MWNVDGWESLFGIVWFKLVWEVWVLDRSFESCLELFLGPPGWAGYSF